MVSDYPSVKMKDFAITAATSTNAALALAGKYYISAIAEKDLLTFSSDKACIYQSCCI